MTEVTLTRVFRKQVETKYGIKPKLSIQTAEHGDKWLSTFKVQGTDSWNEGDTVSIDVQEKGDFINFNPRNDGGAPQRGNGDANLEARVSKLEATVFGAGEAEAIIEADDLPDMEEETDGGF